MDERFSALFENGDYEMESNATPIDDWMQTKFVERKRGDAGRGFRVFDTQDTEMTKKKTKSRGKRERREREKLTRKKDRMKPKAKFYE